MQPGLHHLGRQHLVLVAAVLALSSACSTTYLARPVGKGNTRVNASVGGPLLALRVPIPAPITTVGVAHGLTDNLDVHVDLHPFAALIKPGPASAPLLALDLGTAWHPVVDPNYSLTIGGNAYGVWNQLDGLVLTDVWAAGNVRPHPDVSLAAGVHNVFRIVSSDPTLNQKSLWTPHAFAQVAWRVLGSDWELELEPRWYAFTEPSKGAVAPYVDIGGLGALGVLVGVNYQFRAAQ